LRSKNIFVNLHYLPIHLQPFYRKFGFKKNQFPVAEEYSETAISIPIYPNLKKEEQIKIINYIKLFLYLLYRFILVGENRNTKLEVAEEIGIQQVKMYHVSR